MPSSFTGTLLIITEQLIDFDDAHDRQRDSQQHPHDFRETGAMPSTSFKPGIHMEAMCTLCARNTVAISSGLSRKEIVKRERLSERQLKI